MNICHHNHKRGRRHAIATPGAAATVALFVLVSAATTSLSFLTADAFVVRNYPPLPAAVAAAASAASSATTTTDISKNRVAQLPSIQFDKETAANGGTFDPLNFSLDTSQSPSTSSVVSPSSGFVVETTYEDQALSTPITSSSSSSSATWETSLQKQQQQQRFFQPAEQLSVAAEGAEEKGGVNILVARGILLLVAALFGTNFAGIKYLEHLCFHPPCHHLASEAALARFGVAGLVSLPFLGGQPKRVLLGGFECGVWITLGYIAQALALAENLPAGKCALLCSLTVVFVPLVSAALYGRPLKFTNVVAGLLALTGVGVLEGMVNVQDLLGIPPATASSLDLTTALTSTTTATTATTTAATAAAATALGPLASFAQSIGVSKGDLLALGQPIGFGYSFLRIEHYQEKFEQENIPNVVMTIAAAQCVAVGLLSLAWVMLEFHGTVPDMSYMMEPHRLMAIGWTGIVTTVVAIYLEGIALQTATATDASLTFSTEPVWASLFGFLLLGEHLGTSSYVGGAIILLACVLGAMPDLQQQAGAEAKTLTDKMIMDTSAISSLSSSLEEYEP